jgi:hypothetical protein
MWHFTSSSHYGQITNHFKQQDTMLAWRLGHNYETFETFIYNIIFEFMY